MGNRRKLAAAWAAAAAATAVLAACGGSATPAKSAGSQSAPPPGGSQAVSPRPAAATISEMKAAIRAASSVHLTGTLSVTSARTVGLDLGLTRSSGFSGTVTQNGIALTIIDAGGKVYIKATQAFLTKLHAPAAVCSVICGKYVAMSAAKGDVLVGQLNMPRLLGSMTGSLPAFTNAGTQTIHAQLAQVLHGADGSTLAVAATGTPYPVEAVSPPGGRGRIAFSQWNSVPRPVPPPASQVIDLSKLGG